MGDEGGREEGGGGGSDRGKAKGAADMERGGEPKTRGPWVMDRSSNLIADRFTHLSPETHPSPMLPCCCDLVSPCTCDPASYPPSVPPCTCDRISRSPPSPDVDREDMTRCAVLR